MSNKNIDKLNKLNSYRKSLIKQINFYILKNDKRNKLFLELKKTKYEIKKLEFKMKMERELKNEKSRKNI